MDPLSRVPNMEELILYYQNKNLGDIEKLRVTCVPESVHQDKVREIFNRMEGNHEEVSDALSFFFFQPRGSVDFFCT